MVEHVFALIGELATGWTIGRLIRKAIRRG